MGNHLHPALKEYQKVNRTVKRRIVARGEEAGAAAGLTALFTAFDTAVGLSTTFFTSAAAETVATEAFRTKFFSFFNVDLAVVAVVNLVALDFPST